MQGLLGPKVRCVLVRQAPNPDSRGGRLTEVQSLIVRAQGHGFVILAFQNVDPGRRPQVQALEKFEELAIFFVDANNFSRLCGAQFSQQHRAVLPQLGDSAAHGDAVRATFLVAKTLEQQRLDFRRNRVLQALGLIVRFGPR